jgi:predicted lipid-binding transport protein (Tim44 family)
VYDTLDGKRYEKHYTVNEIINNEENLTESRFVKIKDVGIYNDTVNDGDVMVQLTVQYDDTTIQITTGIDRCLQILDE